MVLEACKDSVYKKIMEITHSNESTFKHWTEWTETTELSEPRDDRCWVQNCERQLAMERLRMHCDK